MKHKQQVNQKNFKISRLVLFTCMIGFTIIQLYPLVWLTLFSLKNNAEIFEGNVLGLPKVWRWENYATALVDGNTGLYFMNSVLVTGITVIVVILLSSMVSYAVTRMEWKLKRITLVIFLMGMMIPVHSALLPLFVILNKIKLYNTYGALIIPYIGFGLPIAIYIFTGFLQSVPKELEESACIDGCNIYQIFYHIILPMVKPAVATIAIFTFLGTWNELMFAITFITKVRYKTLTVGIQGLASQYNTQWGPIGAGLVIASLPTIVMYIMASNKVQKSLTAGAIKG